MVAVAELARAVEEALAFVSGAPGVKEAEVFAAATQSLLARLNYTSHIPCNGVEEPKSVETHGLGIQVALDGPDGVRLGFGAEPGDLSRAGAERALAKARRAAVHDPEFVCLPRPGTERRTRVDYHDARLAGLADGDLVEAGWRVLRGSLGVFLSSSRLAALAPAAADLRRLGLIVGGDVSVLAQRAAIASSHMPLAQTDESTVITSAVTAMVEAAAAKGSGWSTGTRLDLFTDEAGVEAAGNAVLAIGGERVPAGDYTVVLGPQPVSDLLSNLILPACHASAFTASASPFLGRLGRPVAGRGLDVYDDGARPGLAGSRGMTCEGLPTGRTDLIRDGVLVGLLASWYDAQRLARDPAARRKLGAEGDLAARALVARNGFRSSGTGARAFDCPPGTGASNVVVEARDTVTRDELLARVGDGLYVGRIWYTYPINGLAAGDFTCTVVGDSFIIRGGRIAVPLRANAIRISDNIMRVLAAIVGATGAPRGTPVWGADEVVYAPEIAVGGVHVY